MSERIMVVPTSIFHEIGYFQGFASEVEAYRSVLLRPENYLFLPRSEAENDPNYKQLIPYMIFCFTDSQGETLVFRYVRGKGQGEKRLLMKKSIGVGGHISYDDQLAVGENSDDLYRAGMLRELHEEVVLRSDYTEKCVGMINDDRTEVGRVHLGIVHQFDLQRPEMESNEPDLIECGFVPVSQLLQNLDDFESWSEISLKTLFLD